MTAIQFTPADRDERGFIAAPGEPRSLADLLPPVAPVADGDIRRRPPTMAEQAAIAVLGVLLIGLLVYLWSTRSVPTAPPQPPTALPTFQPTSAPAAPVAVAIRLLVAFAAPDGFPLGAIESTRPITPTAHYGDDWIQADVQGSGLVWLRASDAPELPIVGPDLAPRRPALRDAPAGRLDAAASFVPTVTEPPAPTQCAEVGIPGKQSRSCGTDDLSILQERAKAKWIETYGGNIGIVSTPSPQVRQP